MTKQERVIAAAPAPNPEAHKLPSYPYLDWLRFTLASVVALGHEDFPFPRPISAGLAVDVFLALSGWLIGGILIATAAKELPRFFFNRATRIWIPYAFAIALVYGLAWVKEGVDLNWFKYLFYDATFTHYNFVHFPRAAAEMPMGGTGNHFWSLSVEEQFYLLAPIALLFLPFGKKLWAWILLAGVLVLLGERAAPIALGVAAALSQKSYGAWHLQRTNRALLAFATACAFVAMIFVASGLASSLFAIGLVLLLATIGPRSRVGLFLGAISYPLYLNHWLGEFISHAVAKSIGGLPGLTGIAVSYSAAVAVGIGAWWLIDQRVMRWRAGWYTPRTGRRIATLAYATVAIGLVGGLAIGAAG